MNQNAEVKTVKREEIDDSVAIMPKWSFEARGTRIY